MSAANNEHQLNRSRVEVPPFDVTFHHGDDSNGNRKLTLTLEKDIPFDTTEVEAIQTAVIEAIDKIRTTTLVGEI